MSEAGQADDAVPHWARPRASARDYTLAAFSVLCFMAGLFVSEPLIFVSIPVTLVLVFTVLRSSDPRPDLAVERMIERVQVREDESTRVRIRVRNLGRGRVSMLQITDVVHPQLRGRNTRSGFSTSLEPGETKDFYYEVTGQSFGVYGLGPITLRAQDSTGLFGTEAELKSYSKLIVLPGSRERITHLAIRPRRTKPWPGEIMARRAGSGMDYYSVRRFTAGDPMKHVNWRASARHAQAQEELLVNEHIAEVGAEVLIVVDAGRARTADSFHDPATGYSVKAAISIAERLLRDRDRVGLLTTGANARRIPAGYGKRQFDRIAMALLQVEPGDSDFRWWVECSIHMFFPSISQIIFISPLTGDESIEAAAELTRHGEREVIVVSPNPVELAGRKRGKPNSRERSIATRMAELERRLDIGRLRSANILVVDWVTSASLDEVMEVHERALSKYAAFTARHR